VIGINTYATLRRMAILMLFDLLNRVVNDLLDLRLDAWRVQNGLQDLQDDCNFHSYTVAVALNGLSVVIVIALAAAKNVVHGEPVEPVSAL
jgi:hypothetical protein